MPTYLSGRTISMSRDFWAFYKDFRILSKVSMLVFRGLVCLLISLYYIVFHGQMIAFVVITKSSGFSNPKCFRFRDTISRLIWLKHVYIL